MNLNLIGARMAHAMSNITNRPHASLVAIGVAGGAGLGASHGLQAYPKDVARGDVGSAIGAVTDPVLMVSGAVAGAGHAAYHAADFSRETFSGAGFVRDLPVSVFKASSLLMAPLAAYQAALLLTSAG